MLREPEGTCDLTLHADDAVEVDPGASRHVEIPEAWPLILAQEECRSCWNQRDLELARASPFLRRRPSRSDERRDDHHHTGNCHRSFHWFPPGNTSALCASRQGECRSNRAMPARGCAPRVARD